jgi:hypothetical protein
VSHPKQDGPDGSSSQYPLRELLGGKVGYVAIAVSLAIAIAFTIYAVVQGLGGGILFLIWIVVGGFAAIFFARRLTQRSQE